MGTDPTVGCSTRGGTGDFLRVGRRTFGTNEEAKGRDRWLSHGPCVGADATQLCPSPTPRRVRRARREHPLQQSRLPGAPLPRRSPPDSWNTSPVAVPLRVAEGAPPWTSLASADSPPTAAQRPIASLVIDRSPIAPGKPDRVARSRLGARDAVARKWPRQSTAVTRGRSCFNDMEPRCQPARKPPSVPSAQRVEPFSLYARR